MVGCTKCGKNIPGLCRWCPGCGEEASPLLLSSGSDSPNEVTCQYCGNPNSASAENCAFCGSVLVKPKPTVIGENSGQVRGGRIALTSELNSNNTPASPPISSPSNPQVGGRLSRLAQARNKLEAEKKNAGDAGNDWLNSLRSDGPTPTAAPMNLPPPPLPVSEVSSPLREVTTPSPAANNNSKSDQFAWPTEIKNLSQTAPENAPVQKLPDLSPPLEDAVAVPDTSDDYTEVNPALGDLRDDSTIPEWLKELNQGAGTPPVQSKPKTSPQINPSDLPEAGENMPQWLRDFAAASSNVPSIQEDQETDAPEVPARSAPPPSNQTAPSTPAGSSDSPAQAVPSTPPASVPEEDDSELPDWLRSANINNYMEPEAPQRDILDWLKGPTQVDSELPNRPTFGDVDVEERLNFAFDEALDAPPPAATTVPERPRSGLTNILGFSPYAPDEVIGETETPSLPPEEEIAALFLPEPDYQLDLGSDEDLPFIPGFLDSPAFIEQSEAVPAAAGELRPWLEGLKPPVLGTAPVQAASRTTGGIISPNMTAPDLKPWLIGLAPPELEESYSPHSNQNGFSNGQSAAKLSADNGFTPENIQVVRERSTRPFSVGAMFHQTDFLSESFIGDTTQPTFPVEEENEPGSGNGALTNNPDWSLPPLDATSMSASELDMDMVYQSTNKMPDSENPSEFNAGVDFDTVSFSSSDDLTGQELPDQEALSALLASLPDLPDLNLEGFEDYTETAVEAGDEDDEEKASRPWPQDYLNDAADEQADLPTTWDSMVAAANDEDLPPIPVDSAANTQAGFEVAPMPEDKESEDVPATGNDNAETEATQVLPRIRRFNFDDFAKDVEDSYTYTDPIEPPAAAQSNESLRLEGSDEGRTSTFELPEFLANPATAADPVVTEPPTWQRLYVPDAPPAEDEATSEEADNTAELAGTSEEESGDGSELPDFLRNVTLEEKPAVIVPANSVQSSGTPVSSDEADAETEPTAPAPESTENSWASNWNEDEQKAAPAAESTVEESAPTTGPVDAVDPAVNEEGATTVSANPTGDEIAADDEDDEDIPPWLKALSASGPVEAVPPPSVSGYTEMTQGSSAGAFDTPVTDEDLPDWLREDSADPASSSAETASAATESFQKPVQPKGTTADNREIPDWLKETAGQAVPESRVAPPLATNLPTPSNLPDWLKEPEAPALSYAPEDYTGPTAPREPNAGPPVDYSALLEEVPSNQFSSSNFFGDVEGPAWLRQTNQPKPADPPAAPAQSNPVETDTNALPAWLRTVAPPPNAEPVAEEAEVSGGVIPPATRMEDDQETDGATPGSQTVDTQETGDAATEADSEIPSVHLPPRLASAAVLETLLMPPSQVPAEETAAPARRSAGLAGTIIRYVLSIVLIAVALFGLLVPLPVGTLTVSPNVQTFYDQIDGLPANSKVLVTFDWEADRYGEMGPLSKAVVQHVMAKRARLVTLSLNPQGPALAAQVTDELATNSIYGNGSFYKYGTTYLNLGWRSGQEAALRSLFSSIGDLTDYKNGQRAGDLAATAGINSLSDFDLIVVLAGDEGSLRAWVEQVGVQPGAHMVLGVPLAIEPVARPYAQGLATANQNQMSSETQPRAQALLAGLNQTAQYDQLLRDKLNLKTDPSVGVEGRLSAQSLAALVLIVVIILANVVYLARRRRP